ncbi:hypothetical protein SAMD00019534_089520, partial [Acytostelium subglobosum LB1]|uniref:hypothetical protein n=1 Tax=Acytostelium subglobosum LB1 TaxID=1410327 RepID=UPI000644C696
MGNENGRMLTPEEMKNREVGLMDSEMKRKLNTKASKYTLKLVIKGDRNTGKTALFNRLQGKPFTEEYVPTPEIQIAHINWNYKNTDDIVDVEVWDVVDVATTKKKKSASTLVTSHSKQQQQQQDEEEDEPFTVPSKDEMLKKKTSGGSFKIHSLDAQTIDVMKNVSAVIFMVNPHKKWTFQYVERELAKIPADVYVMLITNYRDQGDSSKQLTPGEIQALCEQRAHMQHIDASMYNAYGLRGVVSYFNIPFLQLQRKMLHQQLERNKIEFSSAVEEINMLVKDQNYN